MLQIKSASHLLLDLSVGQDGPRREQTAYDHVIKATSGIMASTGTEEVNP
jgi:crotonobetainyl-CoA:carnitine CoA-transferase CaiB-like acyl-CoA transferase